MKTTKSPLRYSATAASTGASRLRVLVTLLAAAAVGCGGNSSTQDTVGDSGADALDENIIITVDAATPDSGIETDAAVESGRDASGQEAGLMNEAGPKNCPTGPTTQSCGNCGTQTRTCDDATGTWSQWSACTNAGVCAPNSTQSCANGGTQSCGGNCQWGQCTNQTCSGPASQACGNCGTQTRTCDSATGQWSTWSACTGEGVCALGSTESCQNNGAQSCVGACVWSSCTNQTCSGPSSQSCGNCGTQTRTCDGNTGTWSAWSACSGEGVCTPSATASCNTYGSESCTTSCTWSACSCPLAPACTPGAIQCSSTGTGLQTCDTCGQWGAPVGCATGQQCEAGVCGMACTQAVTSYMHWISPNVPLQIAYSMVGGGGGSAAANVRQSCDGISGDCSVGGAGGGGSSAIVVGNGTLIDWAAGGDGGQDGTTASNSFTMPATTSLTVYVGGGGGGSGFQSTQPTLLGEGGGGGAGYFGGGGGSGTGYTLNPPGQGGGGRDTGGAGGVCSGCGGPSGGNGGSQFGGAGGGTCKSAGAIATAGGNGGAAGCAGGGGALGGGGGGGSAFWAGDPSGYAGNGGAEGSNGTGGMNGTGGLGGLNWAAATSLPVEAGRAGWPSNANLNATGGGGGNAGLVILKYFYVGTSCPL